MTPREQVETLKRSMQLYGGSIIEVIQQPEDPDFVLLAEKFREEGHARKGFLTFEEAIEFGYRHALKQLEN